jgi:hypothetical protein
MRMRTGGLSGGAGVMAAGNGCEVMKERALVHGRRRRRIKTRMKIKKRIKDQGED